MLLLCFWRYWNQIFFRVSQISQFFSNLKKNGGGTAAPAVYRRQKIFITFLAESGNLESFETKLFFSAAENGRVISDTTKKVSPNYL